MSHDGHTSKGVYLTVFAALGVFTVVTVGASYLHMPIHKAVILALIIASIKATIVAAWFMHLKTEHKIIYSFLALTVAFVVVLVTLPLLDAMHPEYTVEGSIPAVTSGHDAEHAATPAGHGAPTPQHQK